MRKRIVFAVALAAAIWTVAAVAFAAPATKGPTIKAPESNGCPTPYTVTEFTPFAKQVWRPEKWERGKPKDAVIRHMRWMRKCAAGPGHRKAMKRVWKQAKGAFMDERQYQVAISPPGIGTLEAIAACESGGDPSIVSSDGSYRGKYQFDYGTWESVGGSGDPAAAPEKEQDERAAALYNMSGSSPWPVCG